MKLYSDRFKMLADLVPDKVCVEVGVRGGTYAEAIYKLNPKELYLVDIWRHQTDEVTDGFKYVGGSNKNNETQERLYRKVKRKFNYSNVCVMRMWSHQACNTFADHSLDFVYLDANHAEDAVYVDIKQWIKKVKKGGWLCGHDYVDTGISAETGSELTVKRAVDRYLEETKRSLDLLTNIPSRDDKPDKGVSPSWGILV